MRCFRLQMAECVVVSLFLLSAAPMVFSQAVTGTISGAVKDSTGAVLPGVKIVLLNQETGISRTVQSDGAGRYFASSLSLGNFEVTAALEGFQTVVRSGIVLTVGREAVVDLVMTVGAVVQTVEIIGEAPVIETTSATVSGLVSAEQIRELPLNGRSLTDLTLLNPGVFYNRTSGNSPQDGMGPRLSINGGRQESNLYLMDGTVITDRNGGTSGVTGATLGVEAVREFRVLTHNYGAEYGRSSGGVISLITRSGTNQFHGSLYEFVRNDIFDAREFFNRGEGGKPPFRRNQFGASIGGPVVKDHVFFFANYEGMRQRETSSAVTTVPDADARRGLLPDRANPGQFRNVGVSPLIAPYLNNTALWPLPNENLFGDGTGRAIVNLSVPNNENFYMGRMDFRVSDNDTFYGRFIHNPSDRWRPRPMPTFVSLDEASNQYTTLSETHVFSATALNELRFAFNRNSRGVDTGPIVDYDPALDYNPGQGFGHIRFQESNTTSGLLTAIGAPSGRQFLSVGNVFQVSDTFSLVRGPHSLKFGINIERAQWNTNNLNLTRGEFFFNSLEDLLAARPSRLDGAILNNKFGTRGTRNTLYGWFVQDDYRVRSNLTVNLGFRHEFQTNPYEVNGRSGNLRPVTAALPIVGPMVNLAKMNFAPRLGLAWDPTGSAKTSIRLGAGIYHNQVVAFPNSDPQSSDNFSINNPTTFPRFPANPPLSAKSQATSAWPLDTPTTIQYGLDVQRQLTSALTVRLGYVGSYGYNQTRTTQENIRIPQILPDGRKFWVATAPRYNPNYSNITMLQADTVNNYNALQATVQQALRAGLMFGASYTYGKAMSEADAERNRIVDNLGSFVSLDKDKPGLDYSRSAYDQRHAFVLNSQYMMPWDRYLDSRVAKAVLGGWGVKAVWQYGSGMPLTAQAGFDVSRKGQANTADRVSLVPGRSNNPVEGVTTGCFGGVIPAGQKLKSADRWFDPCAFTLPEAGFFGDVGRNTIDGPSYNTVSFTLEKKTRITESKILELRAEVFNLLNHASFGLPQIQLFGSTRAIAGNAATITFTTSSSRQIQLGAKLTF